MKDRKDKPLSAASTGSITGFTSADHWNNRTWDKLKTWHAIQGAILGKLAANEAEYNDDITISHGLKLMKSIGHTEPMRSLAYMRTMTGLVFITNSGSDMRSYMNVWNVQGAGAQYCNRNKFSIVTKCSLLKYVQKFKKLVAYSPDQKLKLLDDVTRGFEVVSEIAVPCSFFCLEWNPETEEILCGGSHGVYVYKITDDFRLVEATPYSIPIARMTWCVRLQLDLMNNQLMIVCDEKIYVYNYEKGSCTHVLQNRHKLPLTCCLFYETKDLLMTASKDGTIKVWNGMAFTLVKEIIAHAEAVTDLQLHRAEALLFSCSLDFTVKVWRLDTFQIFMRIDVGEKIRGMRMIGSSELFLWSDRQINTYRVNMIYGFYAPVYSTVQHLVRATCHSQPSNIVCSSTDGLVRLFTTITADTYTTIFPTSTFQVMTQIAYIKSEQTFLAVLESGNVVVYDTSTSPCSASRLLEANVQHDEQILSITLIKRDRAAGQLERKDCEHLVFAGHKNGEISLLYSTKTKLLDLCRAHLAPVDMLETSEGMIEPTVNKDLEGPIGTSDRIVSGAKDMKVKVWALVFEDMDPSLCSLICLKSIDVSGLPVMMSMIGSTVAIALPLKMNVSALTMYWLSDDTTINSKTETSGQRRRSINSVSHKGIHEHTHSKSFDHSTIINGLAGHTLHGIFVTTSGDGCLKVWDRQNVLLRELLFEESLTCCCFADVKGTIVVGYKGHLNIVSVENYLPPSMLQKIILSAFQDEMEETPLRYRASTTQLAELSGLAREPAVANPLRNVRMSRDSKSGYLGINWKIQYRANHTYTIEETGSAAAELIDYKSSKDLKSTKQIWRKLGMSQQVANMLSAASSSRPTSVQHSIAETDFPDNPAVEAREDRPIHHSKRYPMPLADYSVEPARKLTRAQFESQVEQLARQKQDDFLEERKRRMDAAKQMQDEQRNGSGWYPIAPDGYIPNSVIRKLLRDLSCKDDKGEPKMALADVRLLLSKLPGLGDVQEQTVNELIVKTIRSKKKAIAQKKEIAPQQQEAVVSLVPDDNKDEVSMEAVKWCNDFLNTVPEVSHFIIRGEEIIDFTPKPVKRSESPLDRTIKPSLIDGSVWHHVVLLSLFFV